MIGYILKTEQYEEIQGQYYSQSQFFNCVQDINDVWFLFLSDQDKEVLTSEYQYLLELPQGEYTPPPSPDFPI